MKLNLGSGETKLEGFINIDCEIKTEPDLVLDLRKAPLPFKDEEIEEIYCIHNIEHIEKKYWNQVFFEFWRVLIPEGNLVLAYPEWEICAGNYINNFKGLKSFWEATLYGRQLYSGDYHISIVTTQIMLVFLKSFGFENFKFGPEDDKPWYTMLTCQKGIRPKTKADVTKDTIFGNNFKIKGSNRFSLK